MTKGPQPRKKTARRHKVVFTTSAIKDKGNMKKLVARRSNKKDKTDSKKINTGRPSKNSPHYQGDKQRKLWDQQDYLSLL